MKIKALQMSVEEWITKVEDNKRQRDTEERAAFSRHLDTLEPPHAHVNMAVLPNGRKIKLDGHTRAYRWQHGTLERPQFLVCTAFHVENEDEAKRLYTMFDSPQAVENAKDRVAGAFREVEFAPKSGFFRRRKIVSGLRLATFSALGVSDTPRNIAIVGFTTYRAVELWLPQIKDFDALNLSPARVTMGIMAGLFLLHRRYPAKVDRAAILAFADGFSRNTGIKQADGAIDAIEGLSRAREVSSGQGQGAGIILMRKTITAGEYYMDNRLLLPSIKRGRTAITGLNPTRHMDDYVMADFRAAWGFENLGVGVTLDTDQPELAPDILHQEVA